jgi:hypothetical protein
MEKIRELWELHIRKTLFFSIGVFLGLFTFMYLFWKKVYDDLEEYDKKRESK